MSEAPFTPSTETDPVRRIPFSKQEEETILRMCAAMRIAAVANVIATAANAVVAVWAGNVGAFIGVLVQVAFAILLFRSAAHFQRVAETDDDDQRHVAEGIDQLRSLFLVKGVLVILALVMVVLIAPLTLVVLLLASL